MAPLYRRILLSDKKAEAANTLNNIPQGKTAAPQSRSGLPETEGLQSDCVGAGGKWGERNVLCFHCSGGYTSTHSPNCTLKKDQFCFHVNYTSIDLTAVGGKTECKVKKD